MSTFIYLPAITPPAMILQRRCGRALPGAAIPALLALRVDRLRGICLAATGDGTLSPHTATTVDQPLRTHGVAQSP